MKPKPKPKLAIIQTPTGNVQTRVQLGVIRNTYPQFMRKLYAALKPQAPAEEPRHG